jgi:hypothetical protein
MTPTPAQYVIAVRLGSEDCTGYVRPANHTPLATDPAHARKFATVAEAVAFIVHDPESFPDEKRERCSIVVEEYVAPESEVAS